MAAIAEPTTLVIDCADPATLAGFYAQATGGSVQDADADYASVGGAIPLGFQRVDAYQSAGWPDPSKHMHLDFKVADIEAATKELVALGATVPQFQPGDGDWVVLADPEGHVFCISAG